MRKYARWILSFLFFVLVCEGGLSVLRRQQEATAWKGITAVLRNEINSSNSYEIARSLSDMEKVNWIKCVVLTENTIGQREFYDTTTQSYCGYPMSRVDGDIQATNGSKWVLSFVVPMDPWFFLLRCLLPILILAAEFGLYRYLDSLRIAREGEKLRAALEKAIAFDVAKQTSHDLASPLSLLKIVSKQQQIPEELREIISRVSERVESIFTDLKAVNQLQKKPGEFRHVAEEFDIDKLLRGSADAKRREVDSSADVIKTDLSGGVVLANQGAISRVVSNVLNNSFEAMVGTDRPQILIASRVVRDRVFITFEDNGCGIPPEILKKIGTKGFSYGKSAETNSGIGLHGAIESVVEFGGKLSLTSTLNVGTTVTIELRLAPTS